MAFRRLSYVRIEYWYSIRNKYLSKRLVCPKNTNYTIDYWLLPPVTSVQVLPILLPWVVTLVTDQSWINALLSNTNLFAGFLRVNHSFWQLTLHRRGRWRWARTRPPRSPYVARRSAIAGCAAFPHLFLASQTPVAISEITIHQLLAYKSFVINMLKFERLNPIILLHQRKK